jgi:GTPase SAR1 family protein
LYSITSRPSFDQILVFRDQILRVKDVDYAPMILVGNKCDLEERREVSKQEGIELAKSWGINFIETSAKTGLNVDEVFHQLVRTICGPMVSRFKLVQRVTLLVLCAQRFSPKSVLSRLPRDVIVMIAKMVIPSYVDGALWRSYVDREVFKLKSGQRSKKSKCSIQ